MTMSKKNKGIVVLLILVFWFCFSQLSGEDTIADGEITVKGVRLEITPERQTVPVNIGTAVNTVFSVDSPGMLEGMVVKGTLRGPGINGSVTLTTLPNHPFAIPGFALKGTYTLENIRLEKEGKVLIAAEPQQAVIEAMDIIVTKVETRPLTLEEIREKGIVISEENFSVYNFSVGFTVNSQQITYDFPIVYSGNDVYVPSRGGSASDSGNFGLSAKEPIPIKFDLPEISITGSGIEEKESGRTISGIVLFNNDIAFLNQFFSVMFIVSNHAPEGSPLGLKNLTASITFPEGLREAETNPPHVTGTPVPVRCPGPDGQIGTADDLDIIMATFSGMAEFLAEGLKEGTHIVTIDFGGTLSGLPSGDVPVSGTASGAVIVRNPEFSITFSHPSVIREGEEYDIYVTMTNTSPVAANLVSLTMPGSRLVGTALLSEETVSFETIDAGQSGTAKFHMLAKETGKIRASAFEAEGNVSGRFVLTAGVGEKGIPLSPDTLVLPGWAYLLPNELVNTSLLLLGEAYSIATTPPGGLPDGVPYISTALVKDRAVEFAEAGQRYTYGDKLVNTVEVLTLDWLGSRLQDINFDILRRLTTKGITLAGEQAKIFSEELNTRTAVEFQRAFTENCSYKAPFFSAILSFAGNSRAANIRIIDSYQNRLSNENGATELLRDIPYGELYLMADGSGRPVDFALIGHVDENGFKIEVLGEVEGTFDLSLTVPGSGGEIQQVMFAGVSCRAGSLSSITFNFTDANFILSTDLEGDGLEDTQTVGSVTPVPVPGLQLISAVQDCSADPAGHATALFFNRPVTPETAQDKNNYHVEGKEIYAAFRQPSGRMVLIGTNNPISPFVESLIRVENLTDTGGGFLTPSPVEMPIVATIKTAGGIVYGQVLTAEGQPVANAKIQLLENDGDKLNRSFAVSDTGGNFRFDFVRILSYPFTIEVLDPTTGKIERVSSRIMSNGQWLKIDIIMRGRGIIKGKVLNSDGTAAAHAAVTARAQGLGTPEYFNTTADEAGAYLIADVPIGPVNLSALLGNTYGAASTTISAPGQIQTVDIVAVAGKTASVSGRVLKSDGSTPVAAAYVNFYGENNYGKGVQTDEQGFFQFSTVPIGNFSIEAYNPLTGKVGGGVTGLLIENQSFNATIILRGTGRVSGTVLSYDGIPQPGVLVYLSDSAFYMDTDSNGAFDFQEVPVGKYQVSAYHRTTGARVSTWVNVLSEGQHVQTTLLFANTLKGGISGTVYDVNGTALPYTDVYVCDGNYIVRGAGKSDSSGHFQVDDLAPDNYIVFVAKTGAAGVANAVVQFPGHLVQCDVRFRGKGNVKINVLAPDGQTGIIADVEFRRLRFAMSQGDRIGFFSYVEHYQSDENGYLEVNDVYVGDFSVFAKNGFYPRGAYYQGRLTDNGQEATVNLVMRPTGKVRAKVVSYDGVTVVPNAALRFEVASLPPIEDIYTDENGEFEFTLVPPGNFSLTAEDTINGFKGRLYGSMGEEGDTLDVTLRLKGLGSVSGTVKNSSEELIANAAVKLFNLGFPGETLETKTNQTGQFTFDRVWEGKFGLAVSPGSTWSGGAAKGSVPGHNAEVTVDVYVDEIPYGTVSGRVFSPDLTSVMTDVQVYLSHSKFNWETVGYFYIGKDNEAGYRFENIPAGTFKLEVLHPASGRRGKADGTLDSDGENVVIDIPLEGRGTVTGTFFDGSHINPVPNASIKIKSNGRFPFELVSSTDSEGNFKFLDVGEGSFDLDATDPASGLTGTASGTVEFDGETVYVDVYARGSGSVTGKVYRSNGTTLVPNARISLTQGSKTFSAYADPDGQYRVDFVPLGSFSLYAYEQPGRDYGAASGRLDFHGQEAQVNVTFKGLGSVAGRVLDGGGNPISAITVNIRSGNDYFSTASNSSGEYRFDSLRLGAFSLEARDPVTKLSGTGSGELTADGQVIMMDLTLESAGSVIGRILNPDGATPAENAYIKLTGSNFSQYYSTGANGEFQFNAVRLGSFSLAVEGYNNSGKARVYGQLDSHGDTVDFNDIALDHVLPEVTGITPVNGSSLVPLNTTVTVHFSEPMSTANITTSTVKLTSASGNVPGSVTLSQDLKSAVFTPSGLLSSFAVYTLVVDGAVEDAAGNKMGTTITSSFTTSDTEPPMVVSVSPANNATGVAANAVIIVTFNEPVDTSNFNNQNLVVSREGVPAAGTITFNESKMSVTFSPTGLQTDSLYSVTVQGAGDFAGNVQTTAFTSLFSTIDTVAPSVQLVPPVQGTTVIEGSTVQLSADIGTSPDIAAVHFFINGTLKHTDTSAPYTFSFTVPMLNPGDSGTFLVEAMAVDHAGNQGTKAHLTFTLKSDAPPTVKLTGPTELTVYPGDTVTCSVSALDDLGLTRITVTASGGTLAYTNTQTPANGQTGFDQSYNINIPVDILPGTGIVLHAEAEDLHGNVVGAGDIILQVPQDEQAPVVRVTSPTEGARFGHTDVINIAANVSDDVGLKEVKIYLDDQLLATHSQPPYTSEFTVPPLDNETPATVKVTAQDLSGKVSEDTVNIVLEQLTDVTAPQVKITAPTDGSQVFPGENLGIIVEATDDEGVKEVEVYIDDQLMQTVTETPYAVDCTIPASAPAGSTIAVKAIARDFDNKTGHDQVLLEVVIGTVLPAGTVIEANDNSYDNQTVIIHDGTVTVNGIHTFAHVLVKEDGVLTHAGATTSVTYEMELTVTGKLVIGKDAKVSVSGRGYLGGFRGSNTSNCGRTLGNTSGSCTRSGASYGGYGGKYGSYAVNEPYGSVYLPAHPGSGGGGEYTTQPGGSGGGVILVTANEVIDDGEISANGGSTNDAGAGSGGSIRLNVVMLKGCGFIYANGGSSTVRAAGGGGRIALYYNDASGFDLSRVTAYGGLYTPGTSTSLNGGAGTVYLKKSSEDGEVFVNNRGTISKYSTPMPGADAGTVTSIEAHKLTDANASFSPGSLAGMELIPNKKKTESFTIIANSETEIETDPADGDMTLVAQPGDNYGFKYPGSFTIDAARTTIKGSLTLTDVTLINSALLTVDGTIKADRLMLQDASIITQYSCTASSETSLQLEVGEIVIDESSEINVNGRGYLGGFCGDNNSEYGRTLGNAQGSYRYSAGSYGGYGGKSGTYAVNDIYGSIYRPEFPGSGGGGESSVEPGGNGGGVIRIVADEIVNNGVISANGGNANHTGAGSGGSVWINTGILSGSGIIAADGGISTVRRCGGGGRIAVYYDDASDFDIANITAYGGTNYSEPTSSWQIGSAGTVYLKKNGEPDQLIIDNRGNGSQNPRIIPLIGPAVVTSLTPDTLTDTSASFMPGSLVDMELIPNIDKPDQTFTIIGNDRTTITIDPSDGDLTTAAKLGDSYGGKFVFPGHLRISRTYWVVINGEMELGNVSVTDNSKLSHPYCTVASEYYLSMKVAGKIFIETGSAITASDQGYEGGFRDDNNSPYGRTLGNVPGSYKYSGGSYGGYGGKYSSYAVNGPYGSIYRPSNPGSGGGGDGSYNRGGRGGGVLHINANEIENNGAISADGGNADLAGAGSGGSIWLEVVTLKGSGIISALGGNCRRGAGGGGRIAVYYTNTSDFDLSSVTAHGGVYTAGTSTSLNGGAGTVYLKQADQEKGNLIIDNNNAPSRTDSTTLPALGQGFNTSLESNHMANTAASFIPGAFAGIELNPQPAGTTVFTIINNTVTDIFTDPTDGDMTLFGNTYDPYIGEHHLFNVTIKGSARVFTLDRIKVTGTLTVEPGSTLTAENHQ